MSLLVPVLVTSVAVLGSVVCFQCAGQCARNDIARPIFLALFLFPMSIDVKNARLLELGLEC